MRANRFSSLSLLFFLGKWLLLAFIIAVLAGTASAFFLFSLQWATATREAHRWLIELLPLAGFAVGWIYLRYGTRVEAGNNLILEEIHDPQRVIPLRMAPLVFFGTVVSHLFGASVGREGTAVQMGASIADRFTALFRLNDDARRMILMAGISAGFSSVFGTPSPERYSGSRSWLSDGWTTAPFFPVCLPRLSPIGSASCGGCSIRTTLLPAFPR